MIILIATVIFLIVGVYFAIKSYSELEFLGIILATISGILLLVLLVAVLFSYTGNKNIEIEYFQEKAYIESLKNNKNLTDEERIKAIQIVINRNKEILKTREWRDSYVFGIYYSYKIGDLPLLDISSIPEAAKKYNVDVNK